MTRVLPSRITSASIRRFIADECDGDAQKFLSGLSDEMNQLMRTNLRRARTFAGRLSRLESQFTGGNRAFLLRLQARYHHLSGDSRTALGLYRRAQTTYRRARDTVAAARIGRAMVDALMYLGRYEDAITVGRQSLRVFRRRKMEVDCAHTLINVGNVYHRRDDNPRALTAYDGAYRILAPTGVNMAVAIVQFNRGNVFSNLGRLEEAATCYEDARKIYRELGMELAALQAEYSLAYLAFLRGEVAESLTRFERLLTEFERLGDARGRAQTQLDMLEIQLHLNLHTVVEADAPAVARRFQHLGMRYEQAKCWYFLAKAEAAVDELSAAKKAISKARRLLDSEGNAVWKGSLDLLEARLLALDRQDARSRAMGRLAERAFRKARDTRRSATATLFLADCDLRSGRWVRSQQRVEPLLRRDAGLPASVAFEAWWLDGRRRRATGDLNGAVASYQKALTRAERMTAGVAPDETRIFFLSDKLAVYHELAGLLIEKQRYRSALAVMEDSRRVRRAEYWSTVRGGAGVVLPRELQRQQTELRARLRKLYGFPESLDRFAPARMETMRKTEDRLWRLVQRGRRLSRAAHGTHLDPGADSRPGRLTAGRAVIVLTTDGEFPGILLLTGSKVRHIRLPVSWRQLRGLLSRFYFFIEKNRIPGGFSNRYETSIISGANDQLVQLSEAIIWPLLDRLHKYEDLTFVPLGMTYAVPFHALPLPDGTLLSDRFRIRHAVDAASATGRVSATLPAQPKGALFSPGRPETEIMDTEASEIRRRFKGSVHYRGKNANREQLRTVLGSDFDFLHIASHASAALDNPIFSEILLNDGPFYAFDLFGGPVRQDLITLSACQTGRPGVFPSGEIYGLAEAFLAQGAKTVLSSLWTVSDHTARVFMSDFYHSVKRGCGLNKSWAQAVVRMRGRHDNPYHWAPFVLIGMSD